MNTITVDGKTYECKYYTYEELKKMFDGKVVFLKQNKNEPPSQDNGVLLDVGTTETKDEIALSYITKGISCSIVDFTPEPILISLKIIDVSETAMKGLELNKEYDWETIASTYPDMYAIITDVVEEDGIIVRCRLLDIAPIGKEAEYTRKYKDKGLKFDSVLTTFRMPGIGGLGGLDVEGRS